MWISNPGWRGYPNIAALVTSSGGATTSWDPANKAASINLTNSNLTATASSPPNVVGVRSIASASSGKKYWEFSVLANGGSIQVGIAMSTWDYTTSSVGSGTGVGLSGGGTVFGTGGNGTHYAVGDRCCFALDISAKLLWCRNIDIGPLWNQDGSADPATGVGGLDVSAYTAPFFAAASFNTSADSLTVNFGATAYAATRPSGYGDW